jgi:hypothetical protein
MNRLLVLLVLLLSTSVASAGKLTFDLVQFDPPAAYKKTAWLKEVKKGDLHSYTVVDKAAGTYCQLGVFQSTASTGDIDAEFLREWKGLVAQYGVTAAAQITDPRVEDGWTVKAGVASFERDHKTAFAMLTTFTGYGRTTSIIALTTSEDFFPAIQSFLGSVQMKKPAGAAATASTSTAATPSTPSTKATKTPAKGGKLQPSEGYMEYSTYTRTWSWKWRFPPPK